MNTHNHTKNRTKIGTFQSSYKYVNGYTGQTKSMGGASNRILLKDLYNDLIMQNPRQITH